MRARLGTGLVAGLLLVAMTPTAALAHAHSPVRLARLSSAAVPAGATAEGPVPSTEMVPFEVVLAPSSPARIASLLSGLYTRSSSEYHRWLRPGQFVADYGPSAAERASVAAWLRSFGATDLVSTGFAVGATASAAALSTALDTPLESYRLPSGKVRLRAAMAPSVPGSVAADIQSIIGLDTLSSAAAPAAGRGRRRTRVPRLTGTAFDGLTACSSAQTLANDGYYTFNDEGSVYGIGSLLADGQNGDGQTIALYELASHSAPDVEGYESCFGLASPVSTVGVDGGGQASPTGTLEADGDIEQVMTQAPGASVVSYEGPNTAAGAYDTWNAMVSTDAAQVISSSWGQCEPAAATNGQISAYTTLFEQAAAQGQSVFVASGDGGSEGCYQADGSTAEEVDYPASDPWVTAVGGTDLFSASDEEAWNDCQSDESESCASAEGGTAASGGGMSRYEARPSYQPNVLYWPNNSQPCGSEYCRELPDISANAGIGMVADIAGAWTTVGGTSFAAPFIAGLAADSNVGCAIALGLWTPSLYALAEQGVYGSALKDVTAGDTDMTGSNDGQYSASAGYDPATGLGSPRAAGLSCPQVTAVKPAAAPPGTTVTVTGLGLERATVSFGGVHAAPVTRSGTTLTVKVPAGGGTVTVSAQDVLGAGTQTSAFAYQSSLKPTAGSGQTAVAGATFKPLAAVLTGSNGKPQPGATVTYTVSDPHHATFPGERSSVSVITAANGSVQAPALTAGHRSGTAAAHFTVTASTPGAATHVTYDLTTIPDAADLMASISGARRVHRQSRFTLHLTALNSGPAPAAGVTTTITLPKGVLLVEGGHAQKGRAWYWTAKTLPAHHRLGYSAVLIDERSKRGSVVIKVHVRSHIKDPNQANNIRRLTIKLE